MQNQLNDLKHKALAQEGFEGSLNDQEQAWLISELTMTPDSSRHVNDLWFRFLKEVEGRTEATLQDARYQWLLSMNLGVRPQFSDLWYRYWFNRAGA